MSFAKALSNDEIACFHILKYSLSTHKNLSEKEIIRTSNYICSFIFDKKQTLKVENLSKFDSLTQFVTYSDQTGICKFALSFNKKLHEAIKSKDFSLLKKLFLGPKEMFVELYDNRYLSPSDKDFLIRLVSREMVSYESLFDKLKLKIINIEDIKHKCSASSYFELSHTKNKNTMFSLTSNCYNEVCIQDSRNLNEDDVLSIMSKYEKPPSSFYTIDKSSKSQTPQMYCFDTLELIASLPINPKTGEKFSKYSLNIINQRFSKEIKMYKRYFELSSKL
jgi:hypothetical protein